MQTLPGSCGLTQQPSIFFFLLLLLKGLRHFLEPASQILLPSTIVVSALLPELGLLASHHSGQQQTLALVA